VTAKDAIHGPQEVVSARLEDQMQIGNLTLLGRTVPVVALAATATTAWYFDHGLLCILTAAGAILSFLMLCLQYMRWRLKARRPRRDFSGPESTVVRDSVARLEPTPIRDLP